MKRQRLLSVLAFGAFLLLPGASSGQAGDPAEAVRELKEGFALKQQGRFEEAYPHLAASVRIAPSLKGLLNLADCEESLHKLLDAERHWNDAIDAAKRANATAFRDEAQSRLDALAKRMPHLTLRLAPQSPPSAVVVLDGGPLPPALLGTAIPADPVTHIIVVHAEGHADKTIEVPLSEGEQKEVPLEAGPGEAPTVIPSATAPPSASSAAEPPPSPPPPASSATEASAPPTPPLRIAGYVIGGVGLAGLVAGSVTGIFALAKRGDVDAHCDTSGKVCDQAGLSAISDARTFATVSTIAFVAGGVAVAAGATLVLFGRPVTPAAAVAPGSAALLLRGTFE